MVQRIVAVCAFLALVAAACVNADIRQLDTFVDGFVGQMRSAEPALAGMNLAVVPNQIASTNDQLVAERLLIQVEKGLSRNHLRMIAQNRRGILLEEVVFTVLNVQADAKSIEIAKSLGVDVMINLSVLTQGSDLVVSLEAFRVRDLVVLSVDQFRIGKAGDENVIAGYLLPSRTAMTLGILGGYGQGSGRDAAALFTLSFGLSYAVLENLDSLIRVTVGARNFKHVDGGTDYSQGGPAVSPRFNFIDLLQVEPGLVYYQPVSDFLRIYLAAYGTFSYASTVWVTIGSDAVNSLGNRFSYGGAADIGAEFRSSDNMSLYPEAGYGIGSFQYGNSPGMDTLYLGYGRAEAGLRLRF